MGTGQRNGCEIEGWSPADVQQWLQSLGESFGKYVGKFEENGIDGKALMELTEEELREDLEITNKFHIKRILRAQKGQESLQASRNEVAAQDQKRITNACINLRNRSESMEVVAANSKSICRETVDAFAEQGIKDHLLPLDIQNVFRAFDDAMVNVIHQRIPLDIVEDMLHLVIQGTAEGTANSDVEGVSSIMQTAKKELVLIQNGQAAICAGCAKMKTLVRVLSMQLQIFTQRVQQDGVATAELREHKDKVTEALDAFVEGLKRVWEGADQGGKDMLSRSQQYMEKLLGGADAMKSNWKSLEGHNKDYEEAKKAYQALKEQASPELTMAFQARAGTLKTRIDRTDSEIGDLCKEKEQMQGALEENRKIVNECVEELSTLEQENANWFGGTTRRRKQEDWERKRADAQRLIDANTAGIKRVREMIAEKKGQLQNMMMIDRKDKWESILKSSPVIELEAEMNRAKKNIDEVHEGMARAKQATGLRDPEAVVNITARYHEALRLLTNSSRKNREFAANLECMSAGMSIYINSVLDTKPETIKMFVCPLLVLPKGLVAIEEFHTEQHGQLEQKTMHDKITRGYLDRMEHESDPTAESAPMDTQ